jgi:hypothetical protein
MSYIKMDLNNPVIKLCMEGTRAEFERRLDGCLPALPANLGSAHG